MEAFRSAGMAKLSREDWHQEWCDEQCETLYCKVHRFIYQWCHSGEAYTDWDEFGKCMEVRNAGNCQHCISDRAKERLAEMEEHKQQILKVA